VVVRVEADLGSVRRQRLAVGAVLAGSGAAAGGSLFAIGTVVAHAAVVAVAPLAAIPVLAGGAAAWALGRGHRNVAERTQAALEQLLDRAETAARPAGALPGRAAGLLDVLDEVRRALR
jgi:hypothetical protein